MKLSKWAKKQDITYVTAYNWYKNGLIPNVYKSPSGSIFVQDKQHKSTNNVIYCRVSDHKSKSNLERQEERCLEFCRAKGIEVHKIYKEVASGMNDNRTRLIKMLNNKPTTIVVENKDRLTRFGFNYIETLLNQQDCSIIVINRDAENESDLVKDMISIMTSFCCRVYGLRRGQNKAKLIKEIIND